MKRRKFLKIAAVSVWRPTEQVDSGWRPPERSHDKEFPEQMAITKKAILLHRFFEAATKRVLQPHAQKSKDCTSHAVALAIDITQAVQVCFNNNRWIKEIATELLHIGGREIIDNRTSGGVSITDSVKFATNYGNLFRTNYADWNFTKYSYNNLTKIDRKTTKQLQPLLIEAKYHPVLNSFRVKNAEQACAALSNLHPVIIGSSTAFGKKRNEHGFVNPVRKRWNHAWTLIGFDTNFRRPGALLMSSWGKNWVTGPKRNQPDGSIWVDLKVLDRMINEAIAISSFKGAK